MASAVAGISAGFPSSLDFCFSSKLYKRGSFNSDWQQRFCTVSLKNFCLSYYETSGDVDNLIALTEVNENKICGQISSEFVSTLTSLGSGAELCNSLKLRGTINLEDVISVGACTFDEQEAPNSFKLVLNSRIYTFRAESKAMVSRWLEMLSLVIDSIKTRVFSVLKKGLIQKYSGILFKKFESRYFMLCPFRLVYFYSEDSMREFEAVASQSYNLFRQACEEIAYGYYSLIRSHVVVKNEKIKVYDYKDNSYCSLKFESSSEKIAWVQALNEEIDFCAKIEDDWLMQSSVVKSEKKKKKKKVEDNKRASTTSTASNMDSCDNNEDNFAAKNVKNDAPFVDINKASKEPIPENPVTPRKQKKRNSVSVSRKVKDDSQEIEDIIYAEIEQWALKSTGDIRVMFKSLDAVFPCVEAASQACLNIPWSISKVELRKLYLNLVKLIHPDKLSNASFEKRTMAKCLFSVLRESFEKYNSENEV